MIPCSAILDNGTRSAIEIIQHIGKAYGMKVLDVGCGNNKMPGAIGIDISRESQADVIYDLNSFPYPFASDEFDLILCNHIVEHVEDPIRFMEELHRIARAGAEVRVVTPHFSNWRSYTDLTHRRHLSASAFDCFVQMAAEVRPSLLGRVLEVEFPVVGARPAVSFDKLSVRLSFGRPWRLLGVSWLANRFLNVYEAYFAFLFPARDLYFVLKAVK